jgi:hypothetical protein
MAVMISQAGNREGLSIAMIKQQADTQKQLANMIEQIAGQPQSDPRFGFSVIA